MFKRQPSYQSKDQRGPGHFRQWLKPQTHREVDPGAEIRGEGAGETADGADSCRERKRGKACSVHWLQPQKVTVTVDIPILAS